MEPNDITQRIELSSNPENNSQDPNTMSNLFVTTCCEIVGGEIQKMRNMGRKCEGCPQIPTCKDEGIV